LTPDNSALASSCNSLTLSLQQSTAIGLIYEWYERSNKPVFHLDGLAGTGKTTLSVALGSDCDDVQYAAFTGKAASVLRMRGAENACTLHSLLYGAPVGTDRRNRPIWRRREGKLLCDLIVADEVSMIDRKLGRDLVNTGIKLLVTGDRAQLPPVQGTAFFNKPDFQLTEIHRQAANAQPLELATLIRDNRRIKTERFDMAVILAADIVIVAFEKTRRDINRMMRRAHGLSRPDPVVGDRVCCYRNNSDSGVLNGTLWTIQTIGQRTTRSDDDVLELELVDDIGNVAVVLTSDRYFYGADPRQAPDDGLDVFSYGYALTCHKAQGSEWDKVAVIDETVSPYFAMIAGQLPVAEFKRRWLYTALTRARKCATVMEGTNG
jgi:exodeoxyribonuclease-5